MRSLFYGTLLIVFVACAGTVQAANELDGKAVTCGYDKDGKLRNLVFEEGKVWEWGVKGYSKVPKYSYSYSLVGTRGVRWANGTEHLDRETLVYMSVRRTKHQCELSSKTKIFQILDESITKAKRRNKL